MLSLGWALVGLAFSMCFAPFGPMLNLYYSYVGLLVEPMWLMLLQFLAYAGPIFGSLEKNSIPEQKCPPQTKMYNVCAFGAGGFGIARWLVNGYATIWYE